VIIGFRYKKKPADREHPFGHGRAELIASLIIGVLLIVIAFDFVLQSINILHNHEQTTFGTLAIVATTISIIAKELMAQFGFWAARQLKSNALRADAWHHRSDSLSSVIILIGIFLNPYFWWIDGALGIAVAIFIAYTAYKILADAVNPLLGETPDPKLVQKIKTICDKRIEAETRPHHFHIHNYGNHIELTFHLKLAGTCSLDEAHSIASEIEEQINTEFGIETTIHMEPFSSIPVKI
jgi:cation diffusion facilitator family transporter